MKTTRDTTGMTGIGNFCENIRPVIAKCWLGERLSKDEQKTIVEFYNEVLHTFHAHNLVRE